MSINDIILHSFGVLGIPVRFVYIRITDDLIVKDRLDKRIGDISDAAYDIYLKAKDGFEEPEESTLIENNGDLNALKERVIELIKEWMPQEG